MERNSTNEELNAFVINYVTRLYHLRDYETLLSIGLTRQTAERIANMSQIDTLRLEGFPAKIAKVQITERHLDLMIQHVQQEDKKDLLIDQLIELEASHAMLKELTDMDSAEYRERRNALGLPKATPGRPPVLDEQQSTDVHRAWHRYEKYEDNELMRYYMVAMETRIPLCRIWHHMQGQH
ncbi:MAG: STY4526/YPO1902 family pathogenicity island replication protein [Candidatus Thiodiazotropha endolucinida]